MTVSLEPRGIILLLVVLGVAALLLVLSYRRTQPPVGRGLRITLGAVRALAFVLLALALLDPVVTLAQRREEEPSVAVLVDVSLSLSLPGRWDAVQTLLAGPGGRPEKGLSPRLSPFLAEISHRARLRLLTFDAAAAEDPRGPASAAELAPRGGATDMAAALRGARQIVGRPLAAVVLVSDGRTTGGEDPLAAARELSVPVYTVLAGDPTPPPDVAVVAARGPELAYVGSRATMEVQVGALGFRGRQLSLVLRDEGGALDSARVAAPADGGLATAELHFTPRQPGAHRYTIELPPQPGEAVLANNERHLLVTVEKERLRVLLLEPVPRWEEKFLERSLAADEGLRVESDFVGVPRGAGAGAHGIQLPARPLEEADVIVLGNFPLEALGAADAQAVASAVERRGAGLLLLGGDRAFRGTASCPGAGAGDRLRRAGPSAPCSRRAGPSIR